MLDTDDDKEFEKHFNELAGEEPADDDVQTDDEELDPEEESETDGDSEHEDGEEQGDDDQSGDKPDDETAKPEEPDELTKLKQENEQLKHQFNSVNGRVSAYQRQAEQYKQQLAQRQEPKPGDNPDGSGMSDEKWEALKKDYPDIAEAFEEKINSLKSTHQKEIESIKGEVEPLRQSHEKERHDKHIREQRETLEASHPDWRDVVSTDEYANWLQTQPQSVQQLMDSTDAQDNIFLLNTFKATQAPKPPAENPVTTKRDRQLQQARTVPSRSRTGAQTAVAEDDYDSAFDFYGSKADKK